MEIQLLPLIVALLYTVHCSPNASNNFDVDGDYNIQNDYADNYDDSEDNEESKMTGGELKIITQPQEFVTNIGEMVTLPCVIEGGISYVQVWRKQDAVLFQSGIKMAATSNMKLLKNGSLEITNLHLQDAGEYECLAMDTAQNSPLIHHKVILRKPPQIESLLAQDNQTTLRTGSTLILTCNANGVPQPVISWHKGSSRLDLEGSRLEIPNVKHHHAGTYKCLADNKIGEPAFSYINIKIEFKPLISVEKLIVSSENNSETELECLVHSEPRAQVVWLKNDLHVVNTDRIHLTSTDHRHNLILKNIQDSDFGVYTCSATNSLGGSKKNISLVPTPAIYRFKNSQTDSKVVLTWDVQSQSNLSGHELYFKRKGASNWMPVDPEGQLDVISVGRDIYEVKYTLIKGLDPGEYELQYRSENNKGWSEDHKTITVEVFAKHGHHKSHKKGHKHGKERQVTPTTSQPVIPAEHQETEKQSGFVKESPSTATGPSGSSSISPQILLISIAVISFLQLRLSSMRL